MTLTLVSGGICRDGGSITADFQRDDGSLLSLMLEVCGVPETGEERRFRHLHVGPTIQSTCDPSTIIVKGSEQEAMLLAELNGWTGNRRERLNDADIAAFEDLLARLPSRAV
jgi:hypothetical protein